MIREAIPDHPVVRLEISRIPSITTSALGRVGWPLIVVWAHAAQQRVKRSERG